MMKNLTAGKVAGTSRDAPKGSKREQLEKVTQFQQLSEQEQSEAEQNLKYLYQLKAFMLSHFLNPN